MAIMCPFLVKEGYLIFVHAQHWLILLSIQFKFQTAQWSDLLIPPLAYGPDETGQKSKPQKSQLFPWTHNEDEWEVQQNSASIKTQGIGTDKQYDPLLPTQPKSPSSGANHLTEEKRLHKSVMKIRGVQNLSLQ